MKKVKQIAHSPAFYRRGCGAHGDHWFSRAERAGLRAACWVVEKPSSPPVVSTHTASSRPGLTGSVHLVAGAGALAGHFGTILNP